MGQGWIDVQVQIDMDAGEFTGLLNDPWMVGAWQEERLIHLYWPHERWTAETQQVVAELIQTVSQGGSYSVHSLPDEDWNLTWARSVVPFRVGRRIVIRLSWQAAAVNPGDVELILDPKQAWDRPSCDDTIDVGMAGSAPSRERTGAGRRHRQRNSGHGGGAAGRNIEAWGIDHDPVAIECAVGYAAQNGFGGELKLDTSGLADVPDAWSDVLITEISIAERYSGWWTFSPRLLSAPGWLVISGILSGDRSEVIRSLSRVGGAPVWERERDGWLAIHFSFDQDSR